MEIVNNHDIRVGDIRILFIKDPNEPFRYMRTKVEIINLAYENRDLWNVRLVETNNMYPNVISSRWLCGLVERGRLAGEYEVCE